MEASIRGNDQDLFNAVGIDIYMCCAGYLGREMVLSVHVLCGWAQVRTVGW
jgi:hypothetical protein